MNLVVDSSDHYNIFEVNNYDSKILKLAADDISNLIIKYTTNGSASLINILSKVKRISPSNLPTLFIYCINNIVTLITH